MEIVGLGFHHVRRRRDVEVQIEEEPPRRRRLWLRLQVLDDGGGIGVALVAVVAGGFVWEADLCGDLPGRIWRRQRGGDRLRSGGLAGPREGVEEDESLGKRMRRRRSAGVGDSGDGAEGEPGAGLRATAAVEVRIGHRQI